MIDFTKPVQTRDGRPVEIITTKGRGTYPVLGYAGDSAILFTWTEGGKLLTAHVEAAATDLINVPEPVVGWLNVYPNDNGAAVQHTTYDTAQDRASPGRIALLKFTYIKGNATVEIIEEKA